MTNRELAESCVRTFLRIGAKSGIPREFIDLVTDIEGCLDIVERRSGTGQPDPELIRLALRRGRADDIETASLDELESIGRLISQRKPDF